MYSALDGRPTKLETEILVKKAFKYRLNGLRFKKIAKQLNRSVPTITAYFSVYKKLWQEEKEKQTKELEELSSIKLDNLLEKSLNKADKLLENPRARTSQKQVEMIWKAKKLLTEQRDTSPTIPIRISFEE
jgi:transposase